MSSSSSSAPGPTDSRSPEDRLGDKLPDDLWAAFDDLPAAFAFPPIDPIRNYLRGLNLRSAANLRPLTAQELTDLNGVGPKRWDDFLEYLRRIHELYEQFTAGQDRFLAFYKWATLPVPERETTILEKRRGIKRPARTLEAIGDEMDLSRQRIDQLVTRTEERMQWDLIRRLFRRFLKEPLQDRQSSILRHETILLRDVLLDRLDDLITGDVFSFYRHYLLGEFFPPEEALMDEGYVFENYPAYEAFFDTLDWLDQRLEDHGNWLPVEVLMDYVSGTPLERVPKIVDRLASFSDRFYRHDDCLFQATDDPSFAGSESRPLREILLILGEPATITDIQRALDEQFGIELLERDLRNHLLYNDSIFARTHTQQSIYGLVEWGWAPDQNVKETLRRVLNVADDPLSKEDLFEQVQVRWPSVKLKTVSAYLRRNDRYGQDEEGRWTLSI